MCDEQVNLLQVLFKLPQTQTNMAVPIHTLRHEYIIDTFVMVSDFVLKQLCIQNTFVQILAKHNK